MTAHILVVDDEPDLLELVRINLVRAGHEVSTAETGRDALDELKRAKPDLLVLDLMLPDYSGTEICRQSNANRALLIHCVFDAEKSAAEKQVRSRAV